MRDFVQEIAPQIKRLDTAARPRFLMQANTLLQNDPDARETPPVIAQVASDGRRIVGARVGDSEAWFLTPEGLFDLTEAQRTKPFLGSGAARAIPLIAV
ncbi:MAG: hypothetical protein H7Z41_06595 [Cytophagales bacterium]|nr:hypothetical protein [Armatimonadota bacterium]